MCAAERGFSTSKNKLLSSAKSLTFDLRDREVDRE